jgi:hypothetical protein
VASAFGFFSRYATGQIVELMYICPHCTRATSFHNAVQLPGVRPGAVVANVPPDIEKAYNEARDCMASSAFTAAAMLCRKILMHIAVEKGATAGESFKSYVDFLAKAGYVPPGGKEWVDHIRDKGNEMNHELVFASEAEANDVLGFVEMLLKFIYEFPSRVGTKSAAPAGSSPGTGKK